MNPLELVVFDLAGTTIQDGDAVNRCLRTVLATAGLAVTRDQVNAVMGLPKPVALAALLSTQGAAPVSADDARVHQLHRTFQQRMIEHYAQGPGVEPMPGAQECFELLLRRGARLALDTGFSRDILDVVLRRLGWEGRELFAATVASDEVARGRPHPDLIFEAMRRARVMEAARVGKVGDTPADLHEGTAAGCGWVVGFTQGTHTREQLQSHPHTHLISHLTELPAALS